MLTLEDFKNGLTDFLPVNTPYVAGVTPTSINDIITKHNLFITVENGARSYVPYEKALKEAGSTLLASRINSSGWKTLNLWFLESEENPNTKPSTLYTGLSFCSCCGTNTIKNPFTLAQRILVAGYYYYAFIILNKLSYLALKETKLAEYLKLDFSYESNGQSFYIVSFKKETDKSSYDTKIHGLVNSIFNNHASSNRVSLINELFKAFGVNLKPMQELIYPDDCKESLEAETFYYAKPNNIGVMLVGSDFADHN